MSEPRDIRKLYESETGNSVYYDDEPSYVDWLENYIYKLEKDNA